MGTSLTPDFWRLFAVLLVISATATFVLSAAVDALVVRLQQRRRAHRAPTGGSAGTTERSGERHRVLVHH